MLNLVIPDGDKLQVRCNAGSVLQGYITYRQGTSILQGKETPYVIDHTGTGAVTDLFTAVGDCIVTSWSVYNSTAGDANVAFLVEGAETGNVVPALPSFAKWTPNGVFLNNGQLITSGEPGENSVIVVTSATSVSVGTGSKVFSYANQSNLGIALGTRVRSSNTAAPANFIEGQVISVSATSMTIDCDTIGGGGTFNDWTIGIIGEIGATGATGANGTNGTNGNDARISTTSTDSIAIGTGTKTLTYSSIPNLGWANGQRLRFYNNASNYMEGVITSVSSTSVTITSDLVQGSGSYSAWTISVTGNPGTMVTDIRTGVSLVANSTLTINTTLNGNFTDHAIYLNNITGGTTENDLIDITNASAEKYYTIRVSRDGTAGTKTINFAGSGRTFNRSWLTGTQAIGVNETWKFLVHAISATVFDVIAQRVA